MFKSSSLPADSVQYSITEMLLLVLYCYVSRKLVTSQAVCSVLYALIAVCCFCVQCRSRKRVRGHRFTLNALRKCILTSSPMLKKLNELDRSRLLVPLGR